MEKGIILTALIILTGCGLIGCGTLMGSKQQVSVDSNPPNAEIINEGRVVDKTPGGLILDTNDPSTHRIVIRKKGYKEEEVNLSTSIDYAVVFWDVILGGVPLLVDLMLGNLDYFERDTYTLSLRKMSENKNNTKNEKDNEENISSVFGKEESQRTEKSSKNRNRDDVPKRSTMKTSMTLEVNNSDYDTYNTIKDSTENKKSINLKRSKYIERKITLNINTKKSNEYIIEFIRGIIDREISVDKVIPTEIVLQIR